MSFNDVQSDDWAKTSIERISAEGKMLGDPDGNFRPNDPITRREMAVLLDRQRAWDGSFKDVLPLVMPAVVTCLISTTEGTGIGSGFFVTSNGYFVTNKHVANLSTDGKMTIYRNAGDQSNLTAQIIAVDSNNDLALCKVEAETAYLELAETELKMGDHVGVVGSPHGYSGTFTQGQVSRVNSPTDVTDLVVDKFQTDAPINGGNSGGPIINELGQVVGVSVAKYVDVSIEGIAWGIHVKYVIEFLKQQGVL